MGRSLLLSHVLFVDNVLLFSNGSPREANKQWENLDLYSKATVINIYIHKSAISFNDLEVEEKRQILRILPFKHTDFQTGFKYLGF
jgi:hypothetical protein